MSKAPPDSVVAGPKVKLGPFEVGKILVSNLGILSKVLVVLIKHREMDFELLGFHDFVRGVTDGVIHKSGWPSVGRVVRDGELEGEHTLKIR